MRTIIDVMKKWIIGAAILLSLLAFASFSPSPHFVGSAQRVTDHAIWNRLLQEHVSADGWVDYAGFQAAEVQLDAYLTILSKSTPAESWSEADKLAYWINAYNAFTVKLIVDHYPLGSIKELHPKPYIPMVNSVWNKRFFSLEGRETNLDEIEHKILRKKFDEPRIHFAIVCASVSCPRLRNEAFVAEKLETQLREQAESFINDDLRNQITAEEIRISRIFQWFKGDFTKRGSLIQFLNQYSQVKISENARIRHLDYNWDLNERQSLKRIQQTDR